MAYDETFEAGDATRVARAEEKKHPTNHATWG